MKTLIEMAREVYGANTEWDGASYKRLEQLVELVRADERNSWPAEMEAMERQVNILTDALNDRQRWFDAMTAQHKGDVQYWQDQTLNARAAEREACAKVCDDLAAPGRMSLDDEALYECATLDCADAIRERSET